MNKAPIMEPGEMQLDRDISDSKGSNIIEVSNLPSNETVETISIFFRKKKVTGVSDARFKILSHNNQRKRALLEFEDKEVVSRLLKKKELKLHDEIVTILPHKAAADDKNPSKQLKVMGFCSSTSTDTILMYFESKKKSGGVAESVNFDHFDDERYVIVSYDTVEDIDKVLSVEHRLDGHNLELTIFEPEPVPSVENTIQVTGFKDTTSFDTLELYFESKKKSGAEAEKVELNKDKDCLYVTYCSNEDIEIVLNKTHEIEGNKLDVKKLEATVDLPIIEVTGFKDTTSFDTLELYFESKKNSGAEAEKVELNKDKDCLCVTYKSIEECDLVLSREHEMENCTLILKKHLGTKEKEKRKNENSSSVGNDIMVKLSGFKSTLNETKLQNYIENENKFGAVASSIQFDSDERCVFVTLSSAKDAEKVCGKHHNVGKETFHISIFTPSPTWNDRFLISNLSEDTSVHKLKHYLEGKLECDVIRTLYSDAEDKAIVYCGSNQYDTVFSKADILAKKKLDGKTLTISPVYKSKIAQVSGFIPDIDCEDLELYFENKKKSNGGEVDKVELNKEDMYALVHFDKYEDVCNVCQTDHELEGSKLDVKEYQKCLGIFGGIEDPDNFNQPEPQLISLDDIEQGKLDFIYQTPENQNDFETKMQQLDTVVDWDKQKQIVVMRLSLPSKVQKGRKRAKKWMKNHQSFFKDYMKTISHEEIKLLTEVIELVAIDLKQPQTKKDLIVKFSDSIIIIGWMSDIFNSFIGDIKKLINKIETDLERKKKELVETLSFKYSYAVLEQFGIMKIVQDSSGKLKISSHNSDTEVQFKGTVSEINSAKALIYEKEQTLKSKMLTDYDMSPMIMQLLLKPEVKKHIIESILKDDKEFAIWEGEVLKGKETGSLQVVAKDQPSLDKIIDIFKKSISHVVHELDPESSHLLTDKTWQTFIDGIYDQYEAFIKIVTENSTTISITCISDIIECVMPEIKSFFDTNTTYSRSCKLLRGHDLFIKKYFGKDLQELAGKLKVKITMDEETVGIKVEGTKGKIQEILDAVEKYRKSIECREKNIGEKMSKKFLDSEKGLEVIKSIQGQFRCIILKEKEDIIEAVNEGKELGIFEINNTTIKVIKDDITTLSVDVIVNAANERLAHLGGVAGAISSKGGASIQQECNEYVYRNGSVLEGDCMIGNAGNLPCRKIVHAVGPRWRGGRCKEDKKLAEVILRTLEMVMTYGFKSVAIPAISSGIFGYPLQSATDVIVQSIARHFNKVNRSSITTIYLIDISDKSLHSFIRSLQSSGDFQQVGFDLSSYGQEPRFTHKQGRISEREFEDDDISGEGAYSLPVVESLSRPRFKPTLNTGEIAKASADVIVNSTSPELQLQNGAVSGSIIKAGGPSLQQECNQKYPNGIQVGDIAVTSGGNLKCKSIYHTCLGQYVQGAEKSLQKLILKCLKSAEKSEFQSIAFPAIGTGNLGYPKDIVAKTFYDTINEYGVNGGRIKNINIVVYGGDAASVMAFKKASQSPSIGIQEPIVRPKTSTRALQIAALRIGEIAKMSADVIVNSAPSNLQLQNGAVSASIMKAGGPSLQQECNQKYSSGIQVGNIAVTSGGNLKCKNVYHTCLGQYVQGAEKSLNKLIFDCLVTAEESGYTSIAFPAIGTGNLGYPKDIVAKTFYDTINEYRVNGGGIKSIDIVVYGGDTASVKAFQFMFQSQGSSQQRTLSKKKGKKKPVIQEREEEKLIFVTSNEMVKGIDVGKFKLIVRCGDILSAKVPIIVDSTDKYLSSGGTVSQAIYKVYGKEIKKNKTPAEKEMSEKGIAVTPLDSSKLNFRYIIHVDGDRFKENWKKAISLCLKEADTLKLSSMAFPALGTGIHGNTMEIMAETFHKALSENSNLNYLKTVEIVIFQSNDLDRFITGFTKALNQKKKSKKGIWESLGRVLSYIKGEYSEDEYEYEEFEDISPPVVPLPTKDLNDVSLSIYSDDTHEITKAMEQLDISIKLDVGDLKIDIGDVGLTEIQKGKIFSYEDSHSVIVKIDERLDTIVIRGLMADIGVVSNGVNSILRNALTKEHEKKFSTVLKDVIQWSWLEKGQRIQYSKYANTKIERAFINKDVDFKLKYSNETLTFDFNNMEVIDEHGNKNPLLRQDKVKEATEASGTPTDWKITATSNLNIVQLNSTSKEYQQVESNFKQTLGGQNMAVVKIERIENRSVYQQYMAKKKHMELELKSLASTIEQPVLWHGTDQQAVHNINNYGFNRSYCGKNATMYGQGVYFAVNSSYSVRYAPGTTGQRQMYQCKVLVGQYAQGNSSYRVPPAKPGTSSTYESVVDNVTNPSMYVIFHDTQAYPEYLITF